MTDINTSQAAQQLKVTERTVRNWIEEKIIDAYKLNPQSKSVYRIPQSEIERILRLRIGSKNKNKSRA